MDTPMLPYGAMLVIGLGYTVAAKLYRKAFFWVFLGAAMPAYLAGWSYLEGTAFWAGGLAVLTPLFFLGVGTSALILKTTETPVKHVVSPLDMLGLLFLVPPLVLAFNAALVYIMACAGYF